MATEPGVTLNCICGLPNVPSGPINVHKGVGVGALPAEMHPVVVRAPLTSSVAVPARPQVV